MVTEDDDNPLDSAYDKMLGSLQEDPESFEKAKNEIIEEFIMAQPEEIRQRLRQQQWRIDNDLRRFKDPVARLNRMVEIFWEQFREFQVSLTTFQHPEMAQTEEPKKETAKVLDFKKKD